MSVFYVNIANNNLWIKKPYMLLRTTKHALNIFPSVTQESMVYLYI